MEKVIKVISLVLCFGFLASCEDNIGEGSLAVDIKYENQRLSVVTGLPNRVGNFLSTTSSRPIEFEIVGVTAENGSNTEELFRMVETTVFAREAHTYNNESEASLALKSKVIEVPALQIEKYTGTLIVNDNNTIPSDVYHLDIRVSNVSGSRVIQDAVILEVKDFDLIDFSNVGGKPEITRLGDTPHEIVFRGFNGETEVLSTEIDLFTSRDRNGFNGVFVNDTDEGEVWAVDFPIRSAWTGINILNAAPENESFINFAIGRPGRYEIKVYK